ncbi:hypothetical protein EKA51_18135 [Shigella boydii]|nr:hypothetical protein [Shigella boydii]
MLISSHRDADECLKKHIWPCEMMGFYQLRGLVFCYLWQIIANIPNLQNEIVMCITFLPLSIVRGG